ncbi:Serine/threonine-protein kinase haspin [Sorochytrium milnesiophthora]
MASAQRVVRCYGRTQLRAVTRPAPVFADSDESDNDDSGSEASLPPPKESSGSADALHDSGTSSNGAKDATVEDLESHFLSSLNISSNDQDERLTSSTPMPRRSRIDAQQSLFDGDDSISPIVVAVSEPQIPSSTGSKPSHRRRSQRKLSYSVRDVKRRDSAVGDSSEEKALRAILDMCSCDRVQSFNDVFGGDRYTQYLPAEGWDLIESNSKYTKIGEATYSEVYTDEPHHRTALKVMPFGDRARPVNGEPQRTCVGVLQELAVARRVGALPHFIRLLDAHIVSGPVPAHLLQAWDDYAAAHEAENDRPDGFTDAQLFMVLTLENGGADLEHFKFRDGGQVKSVLAQVCAGLAHAETVAEFEHRDLHWGNVLIQFDASEKGAVRVLEAGGTRAAIGTHGITARIIDFTLSRVRDESGSVLYVPLQDLFDGDADVDFQFEVYRMMRGHTAGNWQAFAPRTNAMWLEYLVDKLASKCPKPWKLRKVLLAFKRTVAECRSAQQVFDRLAQHPDLV